MHWTGYITNAGLSLIANWGERSAINFTSAVGGTGITEEEAVLKEQTQLGDYKQNISIVAYKKDGAKYSVKLQAFAADEEYVLNQIGLFASLDDGDPVLFAIFQNEKGVNILCKEKSPLFSYSFYGTFSFANKGSITCQLDEDAFVTLETLEKHLESYAKFKRITVSELNRNLAANTLYHYIASSTSFDYPFEEALVFGLFENDLHSNAQVGDFPQFAFAKNGRIYWRRHHSEIGYSSFSDWKQISGIESISREEVNDLIASHAHEEVCYSETIDVDLTTCTSIVSADESTLLTEKELSSGDAVVDVNISGYVEIEATTDNIAAIRLKIKGETEYSENLILKSDSKPFTFSGYIEEMRITITFGKLSFSKLTVSETGSKSGFATPEMLKRLITLEENVEAVGNAFEEIHAYAQALIGGDEE